MHDGSAGHGSRLEGRAVAIGQWQGASGAETHSYQHGGIVERGRRAIAEGDIQSTAVTRTDAVCC